MPSMEMTMRRILAGLGLGLTIGLATAITPLAVGSAADDPASPGPGVPCPSPAGPAGASTVPPTSSGEVALLPATDVSGERMFTLGDVAIVEGIMELEVLEATRGWSSSVPPPEGMAAWTFRVRFSWDGREPTGFGTGTPYYNAIGFTMRDDQGFEYANLQSDLLGRQPALLFGTLAEDQSVQGWVTFHAAADAPFVELTYTPISDERVFFKALAP
jgi:hypothetical protein